ncbi:MAG: hypothetical protein HKP30_14495 [Myxococcales bacterium]|nr:hypothetical protein [Myxococcales bacterium]
MQAGDGGDGVRPATGVNPLGTRDQPRQRQRKRRKPRPKQTREPEADEERDESKEKKGRLVDERV